MASFRSDCSLRKGRPAAALRTLDAETGIPTLTDLSYPHLATAIHHSYKKPKGGEFTEGQTTYNTVIRGVHGVVKLANSLLKTTFEALRHISVDP